jgi:hypothetical protein
VASVAVTAAAEAVVALGPSVALLERPGTERRAAARTVGPEEWLLVALQAAAVVVATEPTWVVQARHQDRHQAKVRLAPLATPSVTRWAVSLTHLAVALVPASRVWPLQSAT